MKKENVHAKHKKSLAERFWKQKYLFLLLLPSLVWVILIVSAKYCYVTHELRLHQNDRCKRFTLF